MLTKVRVRGFKCLQDVSVDLGPFNVLIGRNDSGKSSFLQAIAEPSRAWLTKPSMNYAEVCRESFEVRLEAGLSVLEFGTPKWSVMRHRSPDSAADLPQGALELIHGDAGERAAWMEQHAEFIATQPIALSAARIAENAPRDMRDINTLIWAQGKGTSAYLGTLALGDRARFARIEAALQEITGGRVKEIVVDDVGSSTYALSFRLFDNSLIPASHLSQGLLTYLGSLALIERDPVPATVLVEEPENGLHPLRLYELVRLLRSLNARGIQVILTTHSPDLLSACHPSEVRVFLRPARDAPTEVHTLPKDFQRRAMRESLGEVWASRGEDGLLDRPPSTIEPMVIAEPTEK